MKNQIRLVNGKLIPSIGFGTAGLTGNEAYTCTLNALSVGYRMIDTAHMYGNEKEIGKALIDSDIPRAEIFLVSKVDSRSRSYEACRKQIYKSLLDLKTDYIDLYLIHEPYEESVEMWRALEEAYKCGVLKSIGISNFYGTRYTKFMQSVKIKPMVNQMETHIYFQQLQFQQELNKNGIVLMSWSPLTGGSKDFYNNSVLNLIATNHKKTVAQVVLNYLVSRDIIVIPKTRHINRMKENLDIFDFTLTPLEIKSIESLDENKTLFSWTNEFK